MQSEPRMCVQASASCDLAQELANLMVGIAAHIARARRSLPPVDPFGSQLQNIDDAFGEPISLARKLVMAVHANHACSEAPVH